MGADDGMSWAPFYPDKGKVPVVLYEDEGNHRRIIEKTVFHVRAEVENANQMFDEFLEFPGTPMTKTSNCFLQWKDRDKGTVWGLKFAMPSDLDSFLRVCLSGLTSGQVTHTISTRALADAVDGPLVNDKEPPSRGSSLRRPASVIESSIDELTVDAAATQHDVQMPAVNEAVQPSAGIEETTTTASESDQATGTADTEEKAQSAEGSRVGDDSRDNSRHSDADPGDYDADEPECTYIDDLDDPSAAATSTATPVQVRARDASADDAVPDAAPDSMLCSPTDSVLLKRDSDIEHVSLNLTEDIMSRFPITIVGKMNGNPEEEVSAEAEASATGTQSVGSAGLSSVRTPPAGFLESTEDLPADVRDDVILTSPIPTSPDWIESGFSMEAFPTTSAQQRSDLDTTLDESAEKPVEGRVSPSIAEHEELRKSIYSPGIVPVSSRDNLNMLGDDEDQPEATMEFKIKHSESIDIDELPPSGLVNSLKAKFDSSPRGIIRPKDIEEQTTVAEDVDDKSAENDLHPEGNGHSTTSTLQDPSDVNQRIATTLANGITSKQPQEQSILVNDAVSRTGHLVLKNVIFHKNGRLSSASRRKWKNCWAVLRSTNLTLHQGSAERADGDESAPIVLTLDVTDGIVQSVHEYVYRDYVMSLSSREGHVHYLQATTQADVNAWLDAIHTAAALGTTLAPSRSEAVTELQDRCKTLQEQIETQNEMKQMAVLQRNTSTGKVKSKISEQVSSWSEDIEGFNADMYKCKCYIAALKEEELPNPQTLLACASKATKATLRSQVANFSVSSLHSLVVARRTAKANNARNAPKQQSKKTGPEPDIVPLRKTQITSTAPTSSNDAIPSPMVTAKKGVLPADLSNGSNNHETSSGISADDDSPSVGAVDSNGSVVEVEQGEPVWRALANAEDTKLATTSQPKYLRIELPDKQSTVILLQTGMTAGDVLDIACEKRNLDPDGTFLVLGLNRPDSDLDFRLANLDQAMEDMMYDIVEVREKLVRTVLLALPDARTLVNRKVFFGFEVDICEGAALDQPSVYVTDVLPNSVAHSAELYIGDEILTINTEAVEEQTRSRIIELLQAPMLSLVVRSCGTFHAAPDTTIIDELVCPAPPSFVDLTDGTLEELMVPKPPGKDKPGDAGEDGQEDNFAEVETEQIDKFLQNIEELNAYLLTLQMEAPPVAVLPSMNETVSKEKRLAMCAQELVDTERQYIKKLSILLDRYLEPLRFETFMTKETLELIFGNIRDVVAFQQQFLQDLEDALRHIQSDLEKTSPQSLRLMVFSLSGSVLFYMRRFKMYSAFCVSHMEANLFLNKPESLANEQLQEFLRVRNPKRDAAMSLPSLLIMPILRLMRYPLFLETMRSYTVRDSTEYQRLTEAKAGMEHMADYINEMQRINDQYGVLFHRLLAECAFTEPWLSASVNDLCHSLEVMWLNANQALMHGHSWKKGLGPRVHLFVFKTVIVVLSSDIQKTKRKTAKNIADAPAMQQTACTLEDLHFWTVIRTSRAKVVDLPDSDGVTGMLQLVNKTTQPATPYLFRFIEQADKAHTFTVIRDAIRERSAALTALTPGTARRRLAGTQHHGNNNNIATGHISITSYSRLHEASTSTRLVSPDSEDTSAVFTRSAQLRTSNRKRRASECGRSIEAAANAAIGASEVYFATEEVNC